MTNLLSKLNKASIGVYVFKLSIVLMLSFFYAGMVSAAAFTTPTNNSTSGSSATPEMSFTATEDHSRGDEIILTWNTKNVDSCTASGWAPSWEGNLAVSGTKTFSDISQLTTFALVCENDKYEIREYISVSAVGEVLDNDGGSGTVVEKGDDTLSNNTNLVFTSTGQDDRVILEWSATNANTTCTGSDGISRWNGDRGFAGNFTVLNTEVSEPTTFTLTCVGDGFNVEKEIEVSADDANLVFTSTEEDDRVILEWSATNANTTCTGSDGISRWNGDRGFAGNFTVLNTEVSEPTTFTLTCVGDGFNVEKEVEVSPEGTSSIINDLLVNRPTLEFTSSGVSGTEVVLEWEAKRADTCTASGGTPSWGGEVDVEGEQTITDLTRSTNFSLVCEGSKFKVKKTLRITSTGVVVEEEEEVDEVGEEEEEVRGKYLGYMNDRLFITTESTTRESALENCRTNHENNPDTSVRCTWEGQVIYNRGATESESTSDSDSNSGDSSSSQSAVEVLNNMVEKLLQLIDLYQRLLGFGGTTQDDSETSDSSSSGSDSSSSESESSGSTESSGSNSSGSSSGSSNSSQGGSGSNSSNSGSNSSGSDSSGSEDSGSSNNSSSGSSSSDSSSQSGSGSSNSNDSGSSDNEESNNSGSSGSNDTDNSSSDSNSDDSSGKQDVLRILNLLVEKLLQLLGVYQTLLGLK